VGRSGEGKQTPFLLWPKCYYDINIQIHLGNDDTDPDQQFPNKQFKQDRITSGFAERLM
jgi:hypothetical protein